MPVVAIEHENSVFFNHAVNNFALGPRDIFQRAEKADMRVADIGDDAD